MMSSPMSESASAPDPAPCVHTDLDIRARWLVRVRWGAVAAQAVVVAVVGAGGLRPVGVLLCLAGVSAASNVWLRWRLAADQNVASTWCGVALAFDAVLMTVMLYVSGGPSNPFSVFYLVLITAAAVTLGSRWTWALSALAVSLYAALFVLRAPAPAEMHDHDGHLFMQHLRQMWLALTVAAGLVTYFVTRLSSAIERRDRELAIVRERASRHERVAALTALAAGAAHELGTPLATAMVAAGEMERSLANHGDPLDGRLAGDLRLIREELDRCRRILDGMAGQAGDNVGERPDAIAPGQIVAEAVGALESQEASRVDVILADDAPTVVAPRRALAGAVASLVRNALQAAASPSRVALHVGADGRAVRISVRDEGCGMSPELLRRAGDPFFSTRPPGEGRGLGLFLARSLAERLGGRLAIESSLGRGTIATIEVPASPERGRP
jgi:two-component system, sensor histidine kinase RegB